MSAHRFRRWLVHISVALALALFVLALFFRLLLTNQVLASGDIFLYFMPYRDYAAAALRAGRLPLWNPYSFLGAPFLANPQAAVLYPLHWPLGWLPVTKQIYWSAALHVWLLGMGGYALLRRGGYGALAGLVTAATLAGSGFVGGLLGHINQLNGVAWLPWGVVILETSTSLSTSSGFRILDSVSSWELRLRRAAGVVALWAFCVTMMLLVGHTQTTYINLFGLGAWICGRAVLDIRKGAAARQLVWRVAVYVGGVALGTLMAAAQLMPTLELSRIGLRSGGLDYVDASSFSLRPLQLLWTLLPTYGLVDMGRVFGPAYTEYMAYVGVIGLGLAALGAWRGRGTTRWLGLIFMLLGLFLAAGRWNPVYYLFYQIVPGFDLFRAPARWMMLYTLGVAVLAGIGAEHFRFWVLRLCSAQVLDTSTALSTGFGLGMIGLSHVNLRIIYPWAGSVLSGALVVVIMVELVVAARTLPHTQTTAAQAIYGVRTAPAHLLTDPARATLGPAAAGRFLSMSTIEFDPGDMSDFRRILRTEETPQLSEKAFEQLIIALKSQEILVPNLPLFWRVPAVDGFDGGVLPLRRYIDFLTLFVPADELVPDGRLREQVTDVPESNFLGMLNVQYLITDKVRDWWYEDVYYDRQIGARLDGTEVQAVEVEAPVPFEATDIGLLAYIEADDRELTILAEHNVPVARVEADFADGTIQSFTLLAGGQPGAHLADGALDSPLAVASGSPVGYRDVEGRRQEYAVRLALDKPTTLTGLRITRMGTPLQPDALTTGDTRQDSTFTGAVTVQAATLIDTRTGMFEPLLVSDRGRYRLVHSGDVKVYENLDVLPRAYMVHDVMLTASPAEALVQLHSGELDFGQSAIVEATVLQPPVEAPQERAADSVEIVSYAPEIVEVRTSSSAAGLLVLSDTNYPGWTVTVDGVAAEIVPTNYLFRGVALPAGAHQVVFRFQPASWQRGAWLSGAGLLVWLIACAWAIAPISFRNQNTQFAWKSRSHP